MKKLIPLLLLMLTAIFQSCNKYGDVPQRIIIAGKIDHYNPNWQVTIGINKIGFTLESIIAKTDSAGNFMATFESYIPLDVWITYKTNFLVLLHPGDSLFVQFEGNSNDRAELLKSARFSGDAAKTNQNAAKFQQMYFSNEIFYDWGKKLYAVKEYDADQYILHLDTVQHKCNQLYEQFVSEQRPDQVSKHWAQLFAMKDYNHYLGWYVSNSRQFKAEWNETQNAPKGFYDRLCNRLPVEPSMLIGAYVLSDFTTVFHQYVNDKLRDRVTDIGEWQIVPGGGLVGTEGIVDSIKIFSLIEFVPDPLLLQIMLTDFFDKKLEKSDVVAFERYRDVVETYIQAPFLKNPLHRKYHQARQKIDHAMVSISTSLHILNEANDLSGNEIMDDLLQKNKGKLLYVDFWATWSGQCLSEMPYSKDLQIEFMDEDIVFVHFCIESEERHWKTVIDKYVPGGQHYLLSDRQSVEIRKIFKIKDMPFFVLMDKNGVIKEKGTLFTPLTARNKINEMLK